MNLKEIKRCIDTYRNQKNLDKILECAQLLLKESLQQNNKYYQIIASYHIANAHYINGDFIEALKLSLNTLQLCKFVDIPFYEMVLNNLTGIVYGSLSDEITSIDYMLKAYYIALDHPDLNYIYIIENNMGVLFFNLNMYEEAYDYFLKSIERRDIEDMSKMVERDGFNIINLIGCCVKTNNMEEYKKWSPYLDYFLAHFDNETVKDDHRLYKIYQAFYGNDIDRMNELIHEALRYGELNKNRLHILKNLNDIFQLSIKAKEKETCELVYQNIKEIIQDYPDYKYISKLNDLRIQMAIVFGEKEKLFDSLFEYYNDKKKEDDRWKTNLKKSLITKIELEETLNQQKEILKKNKELEKSNEIEDFTKVFNKTAFRNHVVEELSKFKDDQYMAMFVIDLDKFKSINDCYGHLSGDQLLLDVVEILKLQSRDIDYIGRIGGDEFCIFMKNILSTQYIIEKAEMLLHDIKTIRINGIDVNITISIGVQVISKPCTFDDLFIMADNLMYEAKKAGGNRYSIHID